MQLVINIDDKLYKTLKNNIVVVGGLRNGKTFMLNIWTAVVNGTPLPKGHGRLIDARELDGTFWDNLSKLHQYRDITSTINLAPTILEADQEE